MCEVKRCCFWRGSALLLNCAWQHPWCTGMHDLNMTSPHTFIIYMYIYIYVHLLSLHRDPSFPKRPNQTATQTHIAARGSAPTMDQLLSQSDFKNVSNFGTCSFLPFFLHPLARVSQVGKQHKKGLPGVSILVVRIVAKPSEPVATASLDVVWRVAVMSSSTFYPVKT